MEPIPAPQPQSDIPVPKVRVSPMKGRHHDPSKLPWHKATEAKKKKKILVETLVSNLTKDALAGTCGNNDSFLASLGGTTAADRDTIYRLTGTSLEAFNSILKAQLGLAAQRLTARMASPEYCADLKPGELAFAANIATQLHAKVGAVALTQGNITQVNVFQAPDGTGRTKSQIIRALQGLPEEIPVQVIPAKAQG